MKQKQQSKRSGVESRAHLATRLAACSDLAVEVAALLAAALIVQKGELSERELRAMPLVTSHRIGDRVLHRLVSRYGIRVGERRSPQRGYAATTVLVRPSAAQAPSR